jgi:hypothetical protein
VRLTAAITVGSLLVCPSLASADFIDFTALSISPRHSMTIGDVTITAGDEGSNVAIVRGEGLGVVGAGSNGSFDQIMAFAEDSVGNWRNAPGGAFESGADITVDGTITAITIRTYMTFLQGIVPTTLPGFEMSFYPLFDHSASQVNYHGVRPGDTLTFGWPERVSSDPSDPVYEPHSLFRMGLFSNWPQEIPFYYALVDGSGTATVQFGFSLVSMEYTPRPSALLEPATVPEPASLALITVGLLALRRRRTR